MKIIVPYLIKSIENIEEKSVSNNTILYMDV
jgi:hypothetical protein